MSVDQTTGQHILTVSLEDYFQGAAFRKLLTRAHWSRFEQRVQQNTDRTLALLAKMDHRATFFVSSWMAEQIPGLVKRVISEGHEIGSAGCTQQSFRVLSPEQLRLEARESKLLLEQLTGRRVRGFRVADHLLKPEDTWALKILSEEGYDYDSSLSPSLQRFSAEPHRYFLHEESFSGKRFYELPLPAFPLVGLQIPIAGGNYFRQIPQPLLKWAVNSWIRSNPAVFTFYFRIWDLDPDQPEITGAPWLTKVRHYRNAHRIPALLENLLVNRNLVGIAEYLKLPEQALSLQHNLLRPRPVEVRRPASSQATRAAEITILIPCFNESHSLPYLSKALRQLQDASIGEYRFLYIFVDDGSTDQTWATLQDLFGSDSTVTLLRHTVNQGITSAILTGARAARTELVCSLDCDCTYDPMDLRKLLPLATPDVDCVTASPYHPDGKVLNVPAWRRVISGSASALYQAVLGSELHTFTGCFRIYRKTKLLSLTISESGFVGVAEILGKLQLERARVVEYPATLAVRMLGHSKMKLVANTMRHLRLLAYLGWVRYRSSRRPIPIPRETPVPRETLVTPVPHRKSLT